MAALREDVSPYQEEEEKNTEMGFGDRNDRRINL
jgi:uncharacterized protein YhjY with autotransporter beta-barrel domain